VSYLNGEISRLRQEATATPNYVHVIPEGDSNPSCHVCGDKLTIVSYECKFCGASTLPVAPTPKAQEAGWRLVDGVDVRWDEGAKVFVGRKIIYSQSTDEVRAVEAVKSALRLLGATEWAKGRELPTPPEAGKERHEKRG